MRSLGDSFSASFGESWGVSAAVVAQPRYRGPWRLLSTESPQPKKREREKIFWPGDATGYPAAPARAEPEAVAAIAAVEERLQLALEVVVPRGTLPGADALDEAAIAALLLA